MAIDLKRITFGLDWAAVVCPLLLPISFFWDVFTYWRLLLRFWFSQGANAHQDNVRKVQDQVRAWRTEGEGRKMCTARPSWMSISQQQLGYKDRMFRVRVDFLQDIVNIDRENMLVSVEPGITIGFLNRMLVSMGYTLPVVPELDTLTIGGLVMGGGIESTSHKYGLFHHLCKEYEVVTADGEVITANEKENEDIFHAIPMSYGTLGFVVKITLQILEYKPYIRLTYRPSYTLADTVELLSKETHKETENDSVEGIAYSKDTAVIMTGQFVTEDQVEKAKINRQGLWYKPWFYQYVQTFLEKGKGEYVEYVPTLHFHQRHNKPTFWLSHVWLPWAHGPLARLLTGWILPMNHQLLQLVKETFIGGDFADNCILQDFIIPIQHIKAAIELNHTATAIYPLWMVPARLHFPTIPKALLPKAGDVMFVDLGVYGFSEMENFDGRDKTLRKFEKFTLENNGFQALYAETLMSHEEFCTMFPRSVYDQARDQLPLCKKAFPEIYEKVSRQGRQSRREREKKEE